MRRSSFIAAATASQAIVAARARGNATEFVFKLGDPFAIEDPVTVGMVQMAKAIKDETRGRLQIDLYPNGELGSTSSMLSQLRLGSIQLVTMNIGLFSSVVPLAQIGNVGFAYASSEQALRVFDGELGTLIGHELSAKGVYIFPRVWDYGFRGIISSTKPIASVDDFAGFKIRASVTPIFVDMFKSLGASPVGLSENEVYTALQTHFIDGADISLPYIAPEHLNEVTRYLSLPHHVWNGLWLAANAEAWNALPRDLQSVVERNVDKYARAERRSMAMLSASSTDKLQRTGLRTNVPSTDPMRARLDQYYARWKREFGTRAWGFLEAGVGRLG